MTNESLAQGFDLSRYSVIEQSYRDTDSDDMIIQKVIFYISMFKEEISAKLKSVQDLKDDPLGNVLSQIA